MKKFSSLLLSLVLLVSLCACGSNNASNNAAAPAASSQASVESQAPAENNAPAAEPVQTAGLKAGFIFLHDENSTYDKNFIVAAEAACQALGIECVKKTNIPESSECYDAACELADEGCFFVFADSFSHEDFLIQAAQEFPEVQFCHATGTQAHTEGLSNFHNAFANIFQGRYLAGVAAGMKLQEMGETNAPKIGYVGAYTYAEVVSGYTSFFLGVKSIVPDVTMDVIFTGSWYDETAEKEAAQKLIEGGCVLISQHADSMGAPSACETAKVPNVSYNGSTEASCPNTFIVSSRIDWTPYFTYAMSAAAAGEAIADDWTGTIETGSVVLTDLGAAAANGTAEAIETAKAAIMSGDLHVFDTATFTVGGETLTSYMADVDTDEAFTPDHEVIVNGYFDESGADFRSAPFFDVRIDGITLVNEMY